MASKVGSPPGPPVQAPRSNDAASPPAAQPARALGDSSSAAWRAGDARARPAYDPGIDANVLYQAMKGGMAGIGTDGPAIYRALANKTPEQISAIRTAYQEHYGAELDDHLKGELSGLELVRAQKLLQSDQPGADAAA